MVGGGYKEEIGDIQKRPLVVLFKKFVLKSFAILAVKNLCWSLFFKGAQKPVTSLKRDSNTGVNIAMF